MPLGSDVKSTCQVVGPSPLPWPCIGRTANVTQSHGAHSGGLGAQTTHLKQFGAAWALDLVPGV